MVPIGTHTLSEEFGEIREQKSVKNTEKRCQKFRFSFKQENEVFRGFFPFLPKSLPISLSFKFLGIFNIYNMSQVWHIVDI